MAKLKIKPRFNKGLFKSLDNLSIPSIEEIPEWVYKMVLPREFTKESYHYMQVTLKDRKWKFFGIKEIFTIEKGTGLIKDFDKGNIPLVSSKGFNNGVVKFVEKTNKKLFSKNAITVCSNGAIGESFYREEPFYATCDVNVLVPLFLLNVYIAMFLNMIIRSEKYRFNYGRKWGKGKMLSSNIELPVAKDGSPDWHFMECFIKSLPYSKNLEYVNLIKE